MTCGLHYRINCTVCYYFFGHYLKMATYPSVLQVFSYGKRELIRTKFWLPVFWELREWRFSVHNAPFPFFSLLLSMRAIGFGSSGRMNCEFCQVGDGPLSDLAFMQFSCFQCFISPCLLWYLASSFGVLVLRCKWIVFPRCALGFQLLLPCKVCFSSRKNGLTLVCFGVSSSILGVFLSLYACFFTVISLDFLKGCRDKHRTSILHI